jgi:hypothetical protein
VWYCNTRVRTRVRTRVCTRVCDGRVHASGTTEVLSQQSVGRAPGDILLQFSRRTFCGYSPNRGVAGGLICQLRGPPYPPWCVRVMGFVFGIPHIFARICTMAPGHARLRLLNARKGTCPVSMPRTRSWSCNSRHVPHRVHAALRLWLVPSRCLCAPLLACCGGCVWCVWWCAVLCCVCACVRVCVCVRMCHHRLPSSRSSRTSACCAPAGCPIIVMARRPHNPPQTTTAGDPDWLFRGRSVTVVTRSMLRYPCLPRWHGNGRYPEHADTYAAFAQLHSVK